MANRCWTEREVPTISGQFQWKFRRRGKLSFQLEGNSISGSSLTFHAPRSSLSLFPGELHRNDGQLDGTRWPGIFVAGVSVCIFILNHLYQLSGGFMDKDIQVSDSPCVFISSFVFGCSGRRRGN